MFLSQDRLGNDDTLPKRRYLFTSGNVVTTERNCIFFHITEKTSTHVTSLFRAYCCLCSLCLQRVKLFPLSKCLLSIFCGGAKQLLFALLQMCMFKGIIIKPSKISKFPKGTD
jgi:hypothetical protein